MMCTEGISGKKQDVNVLGDSFFVIIKFGVSQKKFKHNFYNVY